MTSEADKFPDSIRILSQWSDQLWYIQTYVMTQQERGGSNVVAVTAVSRGALATCSSLSTLW